MTDHTDERDLSFMDVDNPSPRMLTAEQIEHYNREGYIAPLDGFSAEETEANRAYFNSLIAKLKSLDDGRNAYAINCYQARCGGLWDLCTNSRLLDYVEDIIGPNIVCWASHFFCKEPYDTMSVPWHQDASYWPLTPARTVTVWLAIDDADAENSAMMFIPGTHRLGHLTWQNHEGPAVLNQEIVGSEDLGEPVHDELRAGQFSLHADMLAHGSQPNRSNRRRCGLTIRYCPPEVRVTKKDWRAEAIIARGSDPSGYWDHCPRPDGDDLSAEKAPLSVGGN